MEIKTLFMMLAASGLFVTRGFTPAFLILFGLRFGEQIPWFGRFFILPAGAYPAWLLSDAALIAAGALAVLEIIYTKTDLYSGAELHQFDKYWKPVSFGLVSYGLVPDGLFLRTDEVIEAGLGENAFVIALMLGVFALASLRSGLLSLFAEFDPDDDIGFRKLWSWAEDIWVLLGFFVIVIYPAAMLGLLFIAFGTMSAIKKYFERQEEKAKVPCGQCGQIIYPSALACPHCGTKAAAPRDVGFFGQPKNAPAPDLDAHPFLLAEKKRCPVCATRLKENKTHQTCAACGHVVFGGTEFGGRYVTRITKRVPATLLITFLLSLIPVIGLIPGVIFYRSRIVSPFRRHLPFTTSFTIRVLLRFLFLVMILVQAIPALGGFALPLIALLNHLAYRKGFKRELAKGEPSACRGIAGGDRTRAEV